MFSKETIYKLNAFADTVTNDSRNLYLKKWARYSNRQQQLISMNGLVGEWLLRDVPKELLPLLWLGQFTHVGKGTSYGLGGYLGDF